MKNCLLYGTAYYYEYLPEERMERDLAMMAEAGINTIRIAESTWSTWEPRDGEFDFSKLHRVLEAAQRRGLSVIVGTPTYAIPPWLARKYPDVLSDTHAGVCRYGSRQNFDLTHPGYLFCAERILRRLFEEVQGYSCVVGFQLDNETKPYDTCSPRAQAMFKEYLKERFGTVEALNRRMGLAYWSNSLGDWDDLPDVRGTVNASLGAEYEAFQRSLVTRFLEWQRKICDGYRRPEQFVTHNFDYEWRGYSFGLQPDVESFQAAKNVTVAGCDIYHPSGGSLTGAETAFGGALAYGLKQKNYLVLETQAQGNFGWLPYPGQLRLQAFAHLASGADGVNYWHWHSIHNAVESYWKGVLSHDFSAGAVYREAASIGKDFRRLSDKLLHLKKESRVAVMVSTRSQTGLKWFPTCRQGETPEHTYSDYLRWICDALYRLNAEYAVISDACRDFSGYDVLLLPALYSVEESLIQALRGFVRRGGKLIATFKSFFSDTYLKIYHDAQPHGMTECFGITYDRFTKPEETFLEPAAEGLCFPADCAVTDFMELLETDGLQIAPYTENAGTPGACQSGAQVLCVYRHPVWGGIPAVTLHRYGDGEAVYMGCCFEEKGLEALFSYLLPRWGIALPPERFPVIVRTGRNMQGNRIFYYLNFSGTEARASLPETKRDARARELLSGAAVSFAEPLLLPPWGVKILEFTR